MILSALLIIFLFAYFIGDYIGPKVIPISQDNKFGMPCLRAKDLIVQQYDSKRNLWATRGNLIYKREEEGSKFIRMAHVPTGFSIFWLSNFSIFRRLTKKPECLEIAINVNGDICALSAGFMWYCEYGENIFHKSLKLNHYGMKVGRGILSTGILSANNNVMFFGEYFRNELRTFVRVYRIENAGRSWSIAYEFSPRIIRHIHSIQLDPYSGKLWICAGDTDEEARIGWSDDLFKTFNLIGQGSQIWRVCQLVFTEDAVYWGTDAGSAGDQAGIYRWNKSSKELKHIQKIEGVIFYGTRLAKGTIVLSMEREGAKNEKDFFTRLFIITKDDKIKNIKCGTWKNNNSRLRYAPARLRLQRDQGSNSLIITCLNIRETDNSELIILEEENLISNNY
jgi:hypothetical protein